VGQYGHRLNRLFGMVKRALERAGRKAGRSAMGKAETETGVATVCFRDSSGEVLAEGTVEKGTTLLSAAISLGVDMDHYCGGQCSCGTCRIEVVTGHEQLSERQSMEAMVLGAAHTAAGHRLACQARALGDTVVQVPQWF